MTTIVLALLYLQTGLFGACICVRVPQEDLLLHLLLVKLKCAHLMSSWKEKDEGYFKNLEELIDNDEKLY